MAATETSIALEHAVRELAGRAPLAFDEDRMRQTVDGRVVAVTGAGGSIGSALARRLSELAPARLVLLERSEHDLFEVERTLVDRASCDVAGELGDVGDAEFIAQVLDRHRPAIVFHAAAFKHVPMLERFAVAAVANNVLGTLTLARGCADRGIARLIAVSTDKAVDPIGVMGATKRAVERALASGAAGDAAAVSVRFGNVLGSRGSVVPQFVEAVRRGGPVSVTDPRAARLFLGESEAVALLVSSCWIGTAGDVLAPDLGRPVRIVDLARLVAAGEGREVGEFLTAGLRPGERLVEALVGSRERTAQTEHPAVRRVLGEPPPSSDAAKAWEERVRDAVRRRDAGACVRSLLEMVPEFRPGAELRRAAGLA